MKKDFYLQLISSDHPISQIPAKEDLVPAFLHTPDILMERRAARALQKLIKDLDAWDKIVPVSGFRTRQEQQAIWDQAMRDHGPVYTRQYVAIPGCSEHESGLAIDLARKQDQIDFICPDFPNDGVCGQFLRLAPHYGLILRYPKGKEAVTGIAWEPWHFRYVGIFHAKRMAERRLCLEEYVRQYLGGRMTQSLSRAGAI